MAELTEDQINALIELKNETEACAKQLEGIYKEVKKIDSKKASYLKRIVGKLKTWHGT